MDGFAGQISWQKLYFRRIVKESVRSLPHAHGLELEQTGSTSKSLNNGISDIKNHRHQTQMHGDLKTMQ